MYNTLFSLYSLFSSFMWNFFCNETKDRYMAPEVFKHRKYDKKVDVFSFAMILYEVIFCLDVLDKFAKKFIKAY